MGCGSLFHPRLLRRNTLAGKSPINFLLGSTDTCSIHAFCDCYQINRCYFRYNWCSCDIRAFATMLPDIMASCGVGKHPVSIKRFSDFQIGIGHLTYHVFGLVPLIAWCVLYFSDGNIKGNMRTLNWLSGIVIIGFLLSLMAFGGALNYIIPALLSVSAVILLQQAITGWSREPWITLGGGAIWSLVLSALKLTPAFVFALDYPRAYLHNYFFTNPFRMISYLFRSLFVPETISSWIAMGPGGTLGLHELEFGVSVISALLIAAAFLSHARQMTHPRHPHFSDSRPDFCHTPRYDSRP